MDRPLRLIQTDSPVDELRTCLRCSAEQLLGGAHRQLAIKHGSSQVLVLENSQTTADVDVAAFDRLADLARHPRRRQRKGSARTRRHLSQTLGDEPALLPEPSLGDVGGMHNARQAHQRGVAGEAELLDEHLEAAAPVPMGEIRSGGIEGPAALPRRHGEHVGRGDVADLGVAIDEPADEPRTGDPVGLGPGAGDPDHGYLVTPVPGRGGGLDAGVRRDRRKRHRRWRRPRRRRAPSTGPGR